MHPPNAPSWAHEERLLAQLGPALCECAAHVEAGSTEMAVNCLARAMMSLRAAAAGPLPRLAATMADILARRILRPVIPAIADALTDPSELIDPRSVRSARRALFQLSPFHKAAFAVANRAVIEAMDNEENVHVIDFAGPAAQPCQWIELLRDFHRRPEGSPHLRLTVVHDDKDLLDKTSEVLVDEADRLDMAFQFHYVVGQLETVDVDDLHRVLQLKSGEARAVVCTQQLHRLLATDDADGDGYVSSSFGVSVQYFNSQAAIVAQRLQQMSSSLSSCPPMMMTCEAAAAADDEAYDRSPATPLRFVISPAASSTSTPLFQTPPPPPALASFLCAARSQLAPKVMVVTEQDANHNGASFGTRFAEALHYYAAVYDSLAASAAAAAHRTSRPAAAEPERALAEVERAVLGEEIRDVLLREGARRRERHDRLHQWAARMELAGFRNVPLSYMAIRRGDDMLRRRCAGVRGCDESIIREHAGCLLMCWSSWPLYSVSAWRPNRGDEVSGEPDYYSSTSSSQMVHDAFSV